MNHMWRPTLLKATLAAMALGQWLALQNAAAQISNHTDSFPANGFTNTIEYARFRWSFDRRATSMGTIPDGAKLKALEIIKRERMKRNRPEGPATLLSDSAAFQGGHWTSIGPAPILNGQTVPPSPVSGRIASIAINPTNSNHWLIGAAQGGVWETRDAGTTWLPRTDDQPSLAMGAVAFAPSNPAIMFAGTGEGVASADSYAGMGLLKSTNGGATWQLFSSPNFVRASFSDIKVHPSNPDVLLAATVRGFAGVSGSLLPTPPPVGISKSVDGGMTWSLKLNANIALVGGAWSLQTHPGDFSRHYAGVSSVFGNPFNQSTNGVYRSLNAGDTWTVLDGPWNNLNDAVERVELALAPSNPNVLYVSIQRGFSSPIGIGGTLLGIWKTTNAWTANPAWTQLPNNPTGQNRFWYNHVLTVDPVNPDTLYLGEVFLWKYNGSSWANVTGGLHADQHALVWAGARLLSGNDGGIWSTVNQAASWSNHNSNLAITQFYYGSLHPTDPSFALAGSHDNGTEKWLGPTAWTWIFGGDGGPSAISSRQPDTHWAISFQNLNLLRTTNGGLTFNTALSGLDPWNASFIAPFKKCPCNDDVFIAGTDNLWKSTNFFSAAVPTWFSNGPELGDSHTALAFAPSDTTCRTYAFATRSSGQVTLTTNGGGTWSTLLEFHRYVSGLAFDPANANILYVTISAFDNPAFPPLGHVFKTTNALSPSPAFFNVTPSFVDIPHNCIALDPSDPRIVYVGTDIGIWKSTNGGTNWVHIGPESGMPNVAVFDLQISKATGRLVAFTHGRGAFALVTPPTIIAEGKSGNTFGLSFATLPGLQYTVQYRNSLAVSGWELLQTLTSDGTIAHVTDSLATNSQRFYRLSLQP